VRHLYLFPAVCVAVYSVAFFAVLAVLAVSSVAGASIFGAAVDYSLAWIAVVAASAILSDEYCEYSDAIGIWVYSRS
jgi:uncharacterized membrane protein YdjX (TVP38/TMEM64 family)